MPRPTLALLLCWAATLLQRACGRTGALLTVCSSPCRCPPEPPHCPRGVVAITDGCGCCTICPSLQGEPCDVIQRCDHTRGLECVYPEPMGDTGICRVRQAQGCRLGQYTYSDGDTFTVDCRTQCTCQNGTYGCVSLCPQEGVRPSSSCHNPRLVRLHEACCQEWLCDPPPPVSSPPPDCPSPRTTPWGPCSTTCGLGLSVRSVTTRDCLTWKTETRLCQLRPCDVAPLSLPLSGHHLRRNHVCRATLKAAEPTLLTDEQGCSSSRTYLPKFCGVCKGRCCQPSISTTKRVELTCRDGATRTRPFLWILQCSCKPC